MSTPPARTELADTYPAPNNATFRTGIGKLYDYVTGLLGATGNAAEARAALGAAALTGLSTQDFAAKILTLDNLLKMKTGANIASAATVNLSTATGNLIHITGATPTSAVTMTAGQWMLCIADAAWPLTYHATTNNISGGASYTLTAGDMVLYTYDGTTVRGCIIKANGKAVAALGFAQDFRLTLTSATPVTTADVAGATTIYCTPYKGNQISLYDGSGAWNTLTSAQFSLALGTLTSALPYDVFCYNNAGTPTLEFLAWANATTRATALVYQDGVLVKSGATTRRYLGSFYTTSTTQTCDSKTAGRYLYNYYNRVNRPIRNGYTATRTTTSATLVEINSEIRTLWLNGYEQNIDLTFNGRMGTSGSASAAESMSASIGIDAATSQDCLTSMSCSGPIYSGFSTRINRNDVAVGVHYATGLFAVLAGAGTLSVAGGVENAIRCVLQGVVDA